MSDKRTQLSIFNEGLSRMTDDNLILKETKAESSDIAQFTAEKKSAIKPENVQNCTVLTTVLEDSELKAFIGVARDAIVRSGASIVAAKLQVPKIEKQLKDLRWRKRQKRVVSDLLIFKHAFIELEKNAAGKKVMALNSLDPTKIFPVINEKGTILFWYMPKENVDMSKVITIEAASGKGVITWTVEEIVHFQIDEMTQKFWGTTDIESLKRIIALKDRVLHYMDLLFKQNWFRVHFHGKNVPDEDLRQFIDMFITNMDIPDAPLLTVGIEDLEGKRYLTEEVLLPLIEIKRELRNEMLTLLRVPPIIAGTVDNSNRSNSDVQAHFAFNNRIRAVQEDIEDDISFDMFPKLGIKNAEYKFNEVSNRSLKEIVDVMMLFIGSGGDREIVSKWAQAKGYDIPVDMYDNYVDPMEMQMEQEKNGVKLPQNSDNQPSRKPKDNSGKDGFQVSKE